MEIRETGVLTLEAGVWRVTQLHSSFGVDHAESFGYEITNSLAELVDSLDDDSADSVMATSERGTVPLMFTDIENSTAISEQVGDLVWSEQMSQQMTKLSRVVGPLGGDVIKTLGDGAMIAFPGAGAAILAAVELQRTTSDTGFRIRIGIHTGEAIHRGGDYVGTAVNKAARVTSAANGGEILTSSTTAELAGGTEFTFGEERIAQLKGLSGTHRLIPIIWNTA